MNENIVCLTNIIKSEEDYTWTIVSANDETQMGIDHGYHYETIVFLEAMEESTDRVRAIFRKYNPWHINYTSRLCKCIWI